MSLQFVLNGKTVTADVDPDMPLLWYLRDHAHLTGTKYACGVGACGACTVHLDGAAARSCMLPLRAVAGHQITTIEGISQGDHLHPVQAAWIEEDVPQCGYCQVGQIMATIALLKQNPNPTDADIASLTNLCRCGTYPRIRKAIRRAAAAGGTR
ncbi:MAG TPA: (2Fe-2S)-binding protein [archaeon]|nr:(2Fe-2S)-binding protein [archaeon]